MEPMAGVDAVWLHLDSPTNLVVINTVLSFEATPDWQRVEDRLEDLVQQFPRLAQRPVEALPSFFLPLVSPSWAPVPDFRVGDHIERLRLPAPGGARQLDDCIATQAALALSGNAPLWRAVFIEDPRGGAALLLRTHHAIADGVSLVELLGALADPTPESRSAAAAATPAGIPAGLAQRDPLELARTARELVQGLTGSTARVLGKQPLGTKQYGRLAPLSLAKAKVSARRLGGTVNDLLLGIMAGALGRYLEATEGEQIEVPTIMPVNLARSEERRPGTLGNHFGLSLIKLPAGTAMAQRIALIRQRTEQIKAGDEAYLSHQTMNAIGSTSAVLQRMFNDRYADSASAVVTSVTGPREPISLAGLPVSALMTWVPTTGAIGLGVSFVGYAGSVAIGVQADAGVVPDFDRLLDAFAAEIKAARLR